MDLVGCCSAGHPTPRAVDVSAGGGTGRRRPVTPDTREGARFSMMSTPVHGVARLTKLRYGFSLAAGSRVEERMRLAEKETRAASEDEGCDASERKVPACQGAHGHGLFFSFLLEFLLLLLPVT